MAGESPDRSKQRESSKESTSGSAGPVPEARTEDRDPRLAVARDAAAAGARGGVDTATRVFSVRDLVTDEAEAAEREESAPAEAEDAVKGAETSEDAAEAGADDAETSEDSADSGSAVDEDAAAEGPAGAVGGGAATQSDGASDVRDARTERAEESGGEPEDAGDASADDEPDADAGTGGASGGPGDARLREAVAARVRTGDPETAEGDEKAAEADVAAVDDEPEDDVPVGAEERADAASGGRDKAPADEPQDADPRSGADDSDKAPSDEPQDAPAEADPRTDTDVRDEAPAGEPEDAPVDAGLRTDADGRGSAPVDEPKDAPVGADSRADADARGKAPAGEPEDAPVDADPRAAADVRDEAPADEPQGAERADAGVRDKAPVDEPEDAPVDAGLRTDADVRDRVPADEPQGAERADAGVRDKAPVDESDADDAPVDQATTMLKWPQVDQPTTMLKLGTPKASAPTTDDPSTTDRSPKAPAPKAAQPPEASALKAAQPPEAPAARTPEQEAERTSKFVALKPLDQPSARKPGDATAVVPQVGPERTTQQPLPPKPPLDLLAELTNTPPPPQTPVRTIVRRVKIWTPLVLLLAVVFAIVQVMRPLPTPTLQLTADDSYTFDGDTAGLPWPSEGQGRLDVNGIGTMGAFGKQTPVGIGSVAKAMTAYIVLKDHPLKPGAEGEKITVDALAEKEGGYDKDGESTLNTVKAGDILTEQQALSAIMIPSANNIARLLARWDAGTEAAFIKKMNDTAKELGMTNTTYTDASGLKETTVSTAVDQVKLGNELVKIPALMAITKLPSWKDPSGKTWNNYNRLVPYNGAIGIKTGTTTKAGGNLLFAATKEVGGETVTVVGAILGQHTAPIIDTVNAVSKTAMLAAQDALTSAKILKKGTVVGYVDDGLGGHTPVVLTKDVTAVGWAGLKVKLSFAADDVPHTAKAGTKVGTLTVGDSSDGAVKVPVALGSDLAEPGFGAKLTRLT